MQTECDLEKGLEMRKWVLSAILASEETYLSHLEALLLVSTRTQTHTFHFQSLSSPLLLAPPTLLSQ